MRDPGSAGGDNESDVRTPKPDAPATPAADAVGAAAPAPPEAVAKAKVTNHYVPKLYFRRQLKLKVKRSSVEKAWRDWPFLLTCLCNFRVIEFGYDIPKAVKGTSLFRIAVDEDDIEMLSGDTQRWWLYSLLRRTWAHNWFLILCILPWVFYQLAAGYPFPLVIYQVCTWNFESLEAHHHAFPVLFILACVGVRFNNFFGFKQMYLIFRLDSQAVEQAVRELCGAEQEKISFSAVASAACQTRVTNESFTVSKKMPSTDKVQYAYVCKLVTAALAMGIAVLHDEKDDPNFEVADVSELLANIEKKNKAEKEVPELVDSSDSEDDIGERDDTGRTVKQVAKDDKKQQQLRKTREERRELRAQKQKRARQTQAADAEEEDHKPEYYKLLRGRKPLATPNTLRSSVEIKAKTLYELFEERQRGNRIIIPGDDEQLINFSAVILSPELIEIIRAIEPCKEAEESGFHRHLKELKHPLTGERLKKPTAKTEERLNLAAQIVADHMEKKAKANLAKISKFKPPAKWSEAMKDEMPEKAEQAKQADGIIARFKQRVLAGFPKIGELMLSLKKHARLIGNPGPVANMEDAMSIGPLEELMKECYPHLVTKKMTLDQSDEFIAKLLESMHEEGFEPESDDYSSMDAGWTLNDRIRMRKIAQQVLQHVSDYLNVKLRNYDHVIDADERKLKIKWQLKYISAMMDAKDAILFSGERITSLMNRWLVLTCEFAEDLRCMGIVEGTKAIQATLDGTRKITQGDGDDNLLGRVKGRYISRDDRICRFADMFKLLDICSAWGETRDAELCSRYHIWCGPELGYIHVSKLERNLGRLIAFKVQRSGFTSEGAIKTMPTREGAQTNLSQKELAMICTDVWQRSMSLASTMVVRYYARAVFVYAFSKLKHSVAEAQGTVYDDDMKRLGREDGDHSLVDCLKQIEEKLANAPISTWAMVKVSHFKDVDKLKAWEIIRLKKEWEDADNAMKEAEISEKHIIYPETFFQDFPISSRIARALGIRQACIDVLLEREALEAAACSEHADEQCEAREPEPTHGSTAVTSPLGVLAQALVAEIPGELADVASLSSTDTARDNCGNPASEPERFDISDPESTVGEAPDAATEDTPTHVVINIFDQLPPVERHVINLDGAIARAAKVLTQNPEAAAGAPNLIDMAGTQEHCAVLTSAEEAAKVYVAALVANASSSALAAASNSLAERVLGWDTARVGPFTEFVEPTMPITPDEPNGSNNSNSGDDRTPWSTYPGVTSEMFRDAFLETDASITFPAPPGLEATVRVEPGVGISRFLSANTSIAVASSTDGSSCGEPPSVAQSVHPDSEHCEVCDSTGHLLGDVCPLCDGRPASPHWASLQTAQASAANDVSSHSEEEEDSEELKMQRLQDLRDIRRLVVAHERKDKLIRRNNEAREQYQARFGTPRDDIDSSGNEEINRAIERVAMFEHNAADAIRRNPNAPEMRHIGLQLSRDSLSQRPPGRRVVQDGEHGAPDTEKYGSMLLGSISEHRALNGPTIDGDYEGKRRHVQESHDGIPGAIKHSTYFDRLGWVSDDSDEEDDYGEITRRVTLVQSRYSSMLEPLCSPFRDEPEYDRTNRDYAYQFGGGVPRGHAYKDAVPVNIAAILALAREYKGSNSARSEAGVPSGGGVRESASSTSSGDVKTAGGPKSNVSSMQEAPCSAGVAEIGDTIDLEAGLGAPVRPGLRRTDSSSFIGPLQFLREGLTARADAIVAGLPRVLNLSSNFQTPAIVTSRDPRNSGKTGGVEQGLGTDEPSRPECESDSTTEQQGIASPADPSLSQGSFSKTPTVMPDRVNGQRGGIPQVASVANRHSRGSSKWIPSVCYKTTGCTCSQCKVKDVDVPSSINGGGSQTYGVQKADGRDRGTAGLSTNDRQHPPNHGGSSHSSGTGKPTRRGNRARSKPSGPKE